MHLPPEGFLQPEWSLGDAQDKCLPREAWCAHGPACGSAFSPASPLPAVLRAPGECSSPPASAGQDCKNQPPFLAGCTLFQACWKTPSLREEAHYYPETRHMGEAPAVWRSLGGKWSPICVLFTQLVAEVQHLSMERSQSDERRSVSKTAMPTEAFSLNVPAVQSSNHWGSLKTQNLML